jgi:ribosomal protein S7
MIENPRVLKSLFINHLTLKGKKHLSEKILSKTIKRIQKTSLKNHKSLLKLLIIKTTPVIKIKQINRHRKKKLVEFPYILKKSSRYTQSIKNIIKNSGIKTIQKKIDLKLTHEFLYSLKIFNKKIRQTHEYAFSIKKFAYFRWFK